MINYAVMGSAEKIGMTVFVHLQWILHNWGGEEALQLLKNCWRAASGLASRPRRGCMFSQW